MNYVYAYLSYFGFKDGRATMHGFWEEMDRLAVRQRWHRFGRKRSAGDGVSEGSKHSDDKAA